MPFFSPAIDSDSSYRSAAIFTRASCRLFRPNSQLSVDLIFPEQSLNKSLLALPAEIGTILKIRNEQNVVRFYAICEVYSGRFVLPRNRGDCVRTRNGPGAGPNRSHGRT